MSDIDRIKEKLAKLLKLGEDSAATEGEIANALNIATQMMARHQLTRDDINLEADDPLAKLQFGRHFAFSKASKATLWEKILSPFVKSVIGSVDCYLEAGLPVRRNGIAEMQAGEVRTATAFVFYGPDEDAACAAAMFEELRDAISTMALIRWASWQTGSGRAYAYGFVIGLKRAAADAVLKLKSCDNATTALILQSEKTSLLIVDASREWLTKKHGVKLSPGRKTTLNFKEDNARKALAEGLADGRNYEVDKPVVPSQNKIS